MSEHVTTERLRDFLEAFNRHDLDAIMEFFAEECVFYMPRGTAPRGDQFIGKAAVRAGLAKRFEGIPDVHYGQDQHWACGNFGVSEWTLTGTTQAGERLEVRGVDLLEFAEGRITRKDSFWKLLSCTLLLLTLACHHQPGPVSTPDATVPGLEELRVATRPYAALDSAVAAGYTRNVPNCLVHEHHGAMGYHHTNAQFMDATVDVTRPEILLYERVAGGEYRLNGVEFIVPYRAWPRDSTPPSVLGQAMLREEDLQFWYLHVWAWKSNPDGLFANFHPEVSCSPEASRVFRPSP